MFALNVLKHYYIIIEVQSVNKSCHLLETLLMTVALGKPSNFKHIELLSKIKRFLRTILIVSNEHLRDYES